MRKVIISFRKLNLLSAMEYRISFVMQIFFMILNDVFFFLIWYLFFQRFGSIGGIDFVGMIPLLAIVVEIFAIMHIFFYGYRNISNMVMSGGMDSYFLWPKNILFMVMTSGFSVSAIGDLLYGLGLLMFLPNISIGYVVWVFVVSLFGAIVFLGFILIFQSLAFWLGSSNGLFSAMFEAILGPTHYPPKIFEGTILKYLFMSVIPVYYVAYLPYELVFTFSRMKFGILVASAVFFFGLGYTTFFLGLKRYESGNALNTNVY